MDINIKKINNKIYLLKLVTQTVNSIKTFSQLTNNISFMKNYKEKLAKRLIDSCDYNIENKLLNSFNFNSNMDLYLEMKLMIDDIYQSSQLDQFVQNNTKCSI